MSYISITDFGAVPDGTLQTKAIQATIDHCAQSGDTAVIPPGTFVSGRLNLASNMTLKLEKGAVLAGSLDWHDYSLEPDDDGQWGLGIKRRTSFLQAVGLENVCIEGPGIIDGRDCRNPGGEEGFRGPNACLFLQCRNVRLKDYTIRNSANWAHRVEQTDGLQMENVTVEAGHDGCHMRGCSRVQIDHCRFFTGDDCIAGFDNRDVKVLNTILNTSCNAFRYGGHGLVVENCRIYGPGNFMHRKSKRTRMLGFFYHFSMKREHPLNSGDWHFRNCTMDKVGRLCNLTVSDHPWQTDSCLEDVTFEDCAITDLDDCSWGFSDQEPTLQLAFKRCRISFQKNYASPFIRLQNFRSFLLEDVTLEGLHGNHILESDGSGMVTFSSVLGDGDPTPAPLPNKVDVPN